MVVIYDSILKMVVLEQQSSFLFFLETSQPIFLENLVLALCNSKEQQRTTTTRTGYSVKGLYSSETTRLAEPHKLP